MPVTTRKGPEEKPPDDHYSRLREVYERFDYTRVSKEREFYYLMLIDSLALPKGASPSVLEIGPGDGRLSNLFGLIYPESKVLAMDLSKVNVDTAEKMRQKMGITNVEFKQGNALEMGGKYDIIIASQSILPYSKRLPNDLRTIGAMLNPGGRVAFIATHPDSFPEFTAAASSVMTRKKYSGIFEYESPLRPIGCQTHNSLEAVNTVKMVSIPLEDGSDVEAKSFDVKEVRTAFRTEPTAYLEWLKQFGRIYKIRPGADISTVESLSKDLDADLEKELARKFR